MKHTDYPVLLIYSKEDEAWLARVDLLPGCIADGGTPEEALANAKVAIDDWIAVSKELNRPIPKALDLQEIEEVQIKAMEHQEQQIHQLIQQAVSQVIQQMQTVAPTATIQIAGCETIGARNYSYPVYGGLSVSELRLTKLS